MKHFTWKKLSIVAALTLATPGYLAGCGDDDKPAGHDGGHEDVAMDVAMDTGTDVAPDVSLDVPPDVAPDVPPDAGPGEFVFADDLADAFTRVDRMGMPAIATAVITSKDAYNAADPSDDAAGTFVGEITTNVTGLHTALDDDLVGLGLTPCAAANCVAQAAPLVVPDTLKINPAMPAGFPNGRALVDPVIDVTLAVVLLDLTNPVGCGGAGCTALTLAGVPVNPPANDEEFSADFPYLAAPHTP